MKDSEIALQIQNGNRQAFRALYDLYFDYAIRVATIILNHNQSYAADAVQETFIRVYQYIHLYQADRPFRPWFYKILVNECMRILKKNAKVITIGEGIEQQHSTKPETDRLVENDELYGAIQKLEPHHRIPIVLKYLNGLKDREIAEILDENINTIKSRLFKGRQKLKLLLQEEKEGKADGR